MHSTSWLYIIIAIIAMEIFSTCGNSNSSDSSEEINSNVTETENEANYNDNVTIILKSLVENYDKRVRPHLDTTLKIRVSLEITQIVSIDEIEKNWISEMFWSFVWNDPRLTFNKKMGVDFISLAGEDMNIFWLPKPIFSNEERADLGDYLGENSHLKLYPNGNIILKARFSIKSICRIDFHYYPFDIFDCPNWIEYPQYSSSEVRFIWNQNEDATIFQNPQWSYHHFLVVGEEIAWKNIEDESSSLGFFIYFRRGLAYYILQWYLPTASLVVLSFLAFYLGRKATAERIGLGMTSTLTITILWSSINSALPQVTYLKGVDIYLGFCFFLCCASLIVNTLVGYIENPNQDKKTFCTDCKSWLRNMCGLRFPKSRLVDRCAKICFPLAFFIFNLCYYFKYVPSIDSQLEKLKESPHFYLYNKTVD